MSIKDTRSAWMLAMDALIAYYPHIGGAYIAALRAAGYDDAAIGDDYLAHIRDEPTHEAFLVTMVRRTKEVGKQ